jgi:LysM repeat protein
MEIPMDYIIMPEKFLLILILTSLLVISDQSLAGGFPSDSIGITIYGNQKYILHQVEKDENLFRLSLRYQVQIKDIVQMNPGSEKMIRVGQKLIVPCRINNHNTAVGDSVGNRTGSFHRTDPTEKQITDSLKLKDIRYTQQEKNPDEILPDFEYSRQITEKKGHQPDDRIAESWKDRDFKHIVKRGETVYSIARRYHATTKDIAGWNRLVSNKIYAGQELIVRVMEEVEEEQTVNLHPKNLDSNRETNPGHSEKFKDYNQDNQSYSNTYPKNNPKANELIDNLRIRNPEKLKRIQFKPVPIEYQLAIIFVATRGYIDSVPVGQMSDFEREYIDYMRSQYSDVLFNLREGILDERAALIMRDVALDLAENYR